MAFILDASVTASFFLVESPHPHVDIARKRIKTETAVSPAIWWYEIRNVLLVSERRQRLTSAAAAIAWRDLALLSVHLEQSDEHASLRLAQRYQLSFYDAAYLELGLRMGLPLATRDKSLASAAVAEGASLIGPNP